MAEDERPSVENKNLYTTVKTLNVPDISLEDVGKNSKKKRTLVRRNHDNKKIKRPTNHHQVAFDLAEPVNSNNTLNRDIDDIINDDGTEFKATPSNDDPKVPLDEFVVGGSLAVDEDEDDFVPPDGGWGWVVTLSGFMINTIMFGIHNCFAMLFYDLQLEFDEPSFKTAWIGSISFGCILLCAPLSGYLSSRYGCRIISLIGIVIASVSMFSSSYAPNTDTLFVTYGVGYGVGTSLAYTQGAVIISQYFSSKHALASGIMLSGSSSGTLFMGKIYDHFHEEYSYGWRNILRIFSGLVASTFFFALTYKPVRKKAVRSAKNPQATKHITEFSLWKNKAFGVWLISVGLCKVGYLIPWVHLVKMAAELGYERAFGSNLLQWMGIAATVSRLIVGKMGDMSCVNRLYVSQISTFGMGLINVVQPKFLTHDGMIWYAVALGCLDGGVEILLPVMTLELVGEEELAVAWGCILGVISICCIGPPVGGAIYDGTGSYDGMFYFAGIPMMLAAFTLALIPMWAKKQPQCPALSILSVDPSMLLQNKSKIDESKCNDEDFCL